MQLSERARDLRHRVAEIVGGLTRPQEYELDGAILAAFEELRAAAEAAAYARAADELERIGREQIDARDDAFLLGISFVIRDLAKQK